VIVPEEFYRPTTFPDAQRASRQNADIGARDSVEIGGDGEEVAASV
jgi:hypothetical protein